jgi:hypothetical protein
MADVPVPGRIASYTARNLWRVNQGFARINIIWALIGFLTFVKVWQPTFEYYSVSIGLVFLVLGILYFLSSWGIGYLNERWRLSRAEWEHQIAVQNPEYFQLLKDVERLSQRTEQKP